MAGKITPALADESHSTLAVFPALYELLEIDLPCDRETDGESNTDLLLKGKPVEHTKPMYLQNEIPRE